MKPLRQRWRRGLVWFLAVAALWFPAACTAGDGKASQAQRYGGEWRELLPQPVRPLDPADAVTYSQRRLTALVYDTLVQHGLDGRIEPSIAASWRVAPDGLTYTFTLRQDVVFHDGSPLTAQDVVYSLRRLLNPAHAAIHGWRWSALLGAESALAGLRPPQLGIEALDAATVRLTLARPDPHLLDMLATPVAAIVRHGSDGLDRQGIPNGTGPFVWQAQPADGRIILAANERYFAGRPYLDRVILYAPDPDRDWVAALRAGDLSVLTLLPYEAMPLRETRPWPGPHRIVSPPVIYYVGFNHERPALHQAPLRQALSALLARDAIAAEALGTGKTAAQTLLPPDWYERKRAEVWPDADPEAGMRLLKDAGHGGAALTIGIGPDTWQQRTAAVLKQAFEEAGLTVRVVTRVEPSVDAEIDLFLAAFWADWPDPISLLYPLLHSGTWGAGGNDGLFANPAVDRMLETIRTLPRGDARSAKIVELETMLHSLVPLLPLFHPPMHVFWQPEIRDFEPSVFPHAQRLLHVWLEPAKPEERRDD